MGFIKWAVASLLAPPTLCICTMPTPTAKRRSETHLFRLSDLRRRRTEKPAVVRIFIWYVTWNVAASRFSAAIYCKLFWTTDGQGAVFQPPPFLDA